MNNENLESLLKIIKQNELTSQRFHEVESKILTILNFKDFFKVLLTDIKERFRIPFVWLSLIKDCDNTSFIHNACDDSEMLSDLTNSIDIHIFKKLTLGSSKPILINSEIKPYFKLLPDNKKYFIRSLAIIPLFLDGELIGSLNQGDINPTRFQPDMDTILLEQLAIKVSLCLSNVTAHEKLRFLAFHDPLTGLLNRRVMENVLKKEFSRAKRYNHDLSVIFLDLDDFKIINDTHGHDTGDEVLKFIADNLISISRESDVIARFAGDEFVVILPETGPSEAVNYIKRVLENISCNPFKVESSILTTMLSYGVASIRDNQIISPEALLKGADLELYKSKKNKKPNFAIR